MNKKMSVLFVVFVVLSLTLSACSGAGAATPTPLAVTPVKATAATIAEASVVPVKSANLSFNASGIVEAILKPEGSFAKEGEVIARLKGQERLQSALSAAQMELLSARQALQKMKDNGSVTRAAAELKVANADKKVKDAKKELEKKQYRRGSTANINEAQAKLLLADEGVRLAEESYSGLAGADDQNLNKAAALTALAGARRNRDHALAELNYMLDKPDQYDLNIAKGELAVAEAELATAKSDLAKLNADGLNADDLSLAEARVTSAESQAAAAQSALDDLTLKAAFDGTIIANNLKIGEQTALSNQAQVVLADASTWEIETTDLTELNVNDINEGDAVKVTFDAIPDLELGGKVLRIQSLGQNKQGDITYKVTITLDQQDERLRWNMTALVAFQSKP